MKLAKNILPAPCPTIIWDYGFSLQTEYLICGFHIHRKDKKWVSAFKLPEKKPVSYRKADPEDAVDKEYQIDLKTALGLCSTMSSRLRESTQLRTANLQGNPRPASSAINGKEVERAQRLDTKALRSPAQPPPSSSLETTHKKLQVESRA